MSKEKKNSKWGYVLISALLIAVGLCFMIFSDSLKVLGIVAGIAVAIFGSVFAVLAISSKTRDFAFAMKVTIASICITAGITTAIFNEKAVEIFAAVFSLILIVDASFKLSTSALCKRYGVELWWLILIPAIATIIGSFWMIKYPPSNNTAVSVILGIIFLFEACANVMAIPFGIKLERRQTAEIYYNVYKKDLEKEEKKK